MDQDLPGCSLGANPFHAGQGAGQLAQCLAPGELRLALADQPDGDPLEELGGFLDVQLDALGVPDPAATVAVAQQQLQGRAVQLPAGLGKEAVASAVQRADHRAEQRRTGQVTERGVLVELAGQVAPQLVQPIGVVLLRQSCRTVPGGRERLDVLVPHRQQPQLPEALGAQPVRLDGERSHGRDAPGVRVAVQELREPEVRLFALLRRYLVQAVHQQ